MAISTEGKIGICLALVFGAGTAVVFIAPESAKPVGWTLLAISVLGLVVLAVHHLSDLWKRRHQRGERRKMISFVGFLVCVLGAAAFGTWHFWPAKALPASTDTASVTTALEDAQAADVQSLMSSLNGKDESDLRNYFDFSRQIALNIQIQQARINYDVRGRSKQFNYNMYMFGNGPMLMSTVVAPITHGPGGFHVEATPKDVWIIVTTAQSNNAKTALDRLSQSVNLPDDLKQKVGTLDALVNDNANLLILVMNEKMHEDVRYFTQAYKEGSPYYGVIESEYARKFTPIKPAAADVLKAIRSHWGPRTAS